MLCLPVYGIGAFRGMTAIGATGLALGLHTIHALDLGAVSFRGSLLGVPLLGHTPSL